MNRRRKEAHDYVRANVCVNMCARMKRDRYTGSRYITVGEDAIGFGSGYDTYQPTAHRVIQFAGWPC